MSPPGLQLETNVPQDDGPDHNATEEASSPSRVPVSFFDPVGVSELKRTMSTRSTRSTRSHTQALRANTSLSPIPSPAQKVDSVASSIIEGLGADDAFNFESTLKDLMRR